MRKKLFNGLVLLFGIVYTWCTEDGIERLDERAIQ